MTFLSRRVTAAVPATMQGPNGPCVTRVDNGLARLTFGTPPGVTAPGGTFVSELALTEIRLSWRRQSNSDQIGPSIRPTKGGQEDRSTAESVRVGRGVSHRLRTGTAPEDRNREPD
jgi:hypothetical protein